MTAIIHVVSGIFQRLYLPTPHFSLNPPLTALLFEVQPGFSPTVIYRDGAKSRNECKNIVYGG